MGKKIKELINEHYMRNKKVFDYRIAKNILENMAKSFLFGKRHILILTRDCFRNMVSCGAIRRP